MTMEAPGQSGSLGRMSDDRLDWHLWNWSAWQSRSRYAAFRALWFPVRSVIGVGNMHSPDFDEAVGQVDAACARAVEAGLGGCSPAERAAVHHRHLEAVWRVRGDLDAFYRAALEKVRTHLTRMGIQ